MTETVHPAARWCEICGQIKEKAEYDHCFLCNGIGAYPDYDAVVTEFSDCLPTRQCNACNGMGHRPKDWKNL